MMILFVVFVFGIFGNHVSKADMMTGYGDNLFGHKCSYVWRFPNQTASHNELMTVNMNGNMCKAVQLNYIGRHGARFPSADDLMFFEELRTRILDHSASTKFTSFLQDWKDYPPKVSGHIDDIGRLEMHILGDLYGKALFDLFHGKVSNETIKLAGTNKMRTRTSASEFYKALTKVATGTGLSDITPTVNDPVLKFYENCPNFETGVLKNKTNNYELNTFINSSHFQGVIRNVVHRLGMNITLTLDDMLKILLLCSTDLAVRNSTGWCSILTLNDIDILNYENDLWDYYNLMYGHPLIAKISCPLWVDVFSSLDNAIHKYDAKQTYLLGDLRFGHSHTLDPFYTALGLFHDNEPLRADNYLSMKNRIFYESKVTPFGAHVAFILYNCGGTGPQNYLLKMMVNGKPMAIPGCGSDVCHYQDVKAKYRYYIEDCHWKQLCAVTGPAIG